MKVQELNLGVIQHVADDKTGPTELVDVVDMLQMLSYGQRGGGRV